jgi:hypothetical protein
MRDFQSIWYRRQKFSSGFDFVEYPPTIITPSVKRISISRVPTALS